ncbi:DUF4270 domain-containing protein [Psychroserpens luteus]|uniref:DUF4270 domain-containing protein n=1 Tax=Psychroserpens luteus TaxID=1434066 RepID=A0ABW5ZWL2_9FLAO|nr:DUF4270 domain-containing protein [Psychroserpens luteus]
MKKRKIALRHLALLTILLCSFIACDKDFANIDSDIINNDNATHFDTNARLFDVIAYTKALDPVQTNALPVNLLGIYKDPGVSYGSSKASFVTQITGNSQDPDFGEEPVVDSVVMTIPYFSTATGINSITGNTEYDLDSIYGSGTINLSIYESNYFLRDFDPTASDINEPQNYYSNMSTGSNTINNTQLEGTLLHQIINFSPNSNQIILAEGEGDDRETTAISPALRIKFNDNNYWQEKIINMAGETELSNLNNFNNYFRGLYFKTESNISEGRMTILNMVSSSANIIIYYSREHFTEGLDRVQSTFTFNFSGNTVNFLSNDFTLSSGNEITGDENLYLKGAQGSIAEIKLFNGEDLDEDISTDNTFESFKKEFVETDEDGNFVSSKKLINEANLVFYVDQDKVNAGGDEPNRIYLYDMKNNTVLVDYLFDNANTVSPEFSRISHLVPLERENNEAIGDGIRYKIRITEHLNNLIISDSTNVKLGLAVSANVNLEGSSIQYDLLSTNDNDKVPVSSIVSPRGTVLYGNSTTDDDKKPYLEIFFTEPNN